MLFWLDIFLWNRSTTMCLMDRNNRGNLGLLGRCFSWPGNPCVWGTNVFGKSSVGWSPHIQLDMIYIKYWHIIVDSSFEGTYLANSSDHMDTNGSSISISSSSESICMHCRKSHEALVQADFHLQT